VWTIAAPADDAALRRLLDETGVVVIHDGMGGYAHNAAIHVVVPPGRLVRIFPMEKYREALAFAERIGR
jgi:protein SCO1/2